MTEEMMTDLEKLNLTNLQAAVRCYRNLFYHRTVILEGIRKIAFRNMNHITEAIKYGESKGDGLRDDKWIECIQQKMLADQELDDNELNRMLIEWASFCPLQVYLALLYAEIEYFCKYCKKSEILSNDALSLYLEEKAEYVSMFHGFRNAFLHPSKENTLSESDFLDHEGSYNLAPDLQKTFDEYLVRTRLNLLGLLKRELFSLPDIQRLYCTWQFTDANFKRMEDHQDLQGMEHLVTQLEEFSKQMAKVSEDMRSWSPNSKQERTARILVECLNEVSPSAPEQQFTNLSTKQTPMTIHILEGLLPWEQTSQSFGYGKSVTHLAKNSDLYARIMISGAVLLNEMVTVRGTYSIGQLRELAQSAPLDEFADIRLHAIRGQGLQHANEMISLGRISMALLYEPLRMYGKVVGENDLAALPKLERFFAPERMWTFSKFRNSVFHVLRPPQHPLEVDLATVDPGFFDTGTELDLYTGLAEFLRKVSQHPGQ